MRVLLLAVLLALVTGLSAAAAPTAAPTVTEIRLPRTDPQRLALGGDGSIWATGAYGDVIRLDPSGHVHTYGIGADEYATDLVFGPDGAIWVAAYDRIVRLDNAGNRRSWPVGGSGLAESITSAGGALWFANSGNPGRIERLGTDGSIQSFKVAGPRKNLLMPGIAASQDGQLWFTQAGYPRDPPDGIGRMTTDGHSSSRALTRRRANPTRIAAGPDGGIWFTERDAHAIGRIAPSGTLTEFPLTTGLSPYDIKAGSDEALWFTADSCIGRITTSGDVTAWPVHGAGRLLGIVAAPDGSIWAADDMKGALWHFVPPPGDAPPATPCTPPTITLRARATTASLVYRREVTFRHDDWFTGGRVRISRAGKQLFSETVPTTGIGKRYGYPVYGDSSSFHVRDLDRDGEPEVMVRLNWGGAHCCAWSRVYRFVRSQHTYVPVVHFWGDDGAIPRVRDLNRDGKPEFVSRDSRFAYVFGSYADSWFPLQIWAYRTGRFRDVSRRFERQVRGDATWLWHQYLHRRGKKDADVRGLLAAWAADEYLIGHGAEVWPALKRAASQGYLECPFQCGPDEAYIGDVRGFLRKTGYLR
jgi:streptogramin lyase